MQISAWPAMQSHEFFPCAPQSIEDHSRSSCVDSFSFQHRTEKLAGCLLSNLRQIVVGPDNSFQDKWRNGQACRKISSKYYKKNAIIWLSNKLINFFEQYCHLLTVLSPRLLDNCVIFVYCKIANKRMFAKHSKNSKSSRLILAKLSF